MELRYVVTGTAEGCPSAGEFRASVARELSFDAFGADPTAVIAVTIEDAGRGSRATIELTEGGTFAQQLGAARTECPALAAASVQAVVLAIERLRDAVPIEAEPPPAPPAEPPPAVAAPPRRPAKASPPLRAVAEPPLHIDSHASGAVSRGFVPAIAGGTFVGATASQRWWMASMDLGVWWPTRVTTPVDDAGGSHGATVRALAATAALCATMVPVFACGTAGLLDVQARGTVSAQTRLGMFGARAGWLVPLRFPWATELYLGISVPTSRVLIRAGGEQLWKSPSFAGEAGIRLRVRIL